MQIVVSTVAAICKYSEGHAATKQKEKQTDKQTVTIPVLYNQKTSFYLNICIFNF